MARARTTETPGGAAVIDDAQAAIDAAHKRLRAGEAVSGEELTGSKLQTSANGRGQGSGAGGQVAGLQYLPVKGLLPCGLNPRKHFDAVKLQELAESIKSLGILEPLLARRIPPAENSGVTVSAHYEVIAGERRLRAARLAKLETVPCIVRTMTDVEALEVMVVENQQRVDVSPIEEADGYKALMALAGYDVPAIAKKVGMSASHVYQRMKLAELIEPAKTLLDAELLSPGHAVLIARLQPREQELALMYAYKTGWFNVNTAKPNMGVLLENVLDKEDEGALPLCSVRDLARFIEEEIHCDLKAVKFPKDDGQLVPEAGTCLACPKRTGFNPDLFGAKDGDDRCTDPACFKLKSAAFIKAKQKEIAATLNEGEKVLRVSTEYGARQSGVLKPGQFETAKKSDKGAVAAVDVNTGAVKYVKPRKDETPRKAAMSPEERAEHERKIGEKIKREDLRRKLIFKAIAAKIPKEFTTEHLIMLAERELDNLPQESKSLIVEVLGKTFKSLKQLTDSDLQRIVILAEAAERAPCEQEWDLDNYGVMKFYAAAKEHKIDLKAIDAEVDNQLTGTLPSTGSGQGHAEKAIAAAIAAAVKKAKKGGRGTPALPARKGKRT